MKASEGRILTTHTGSLPRSAELTRLYVARTRGEPVDAAALARAGRDAVRIAVRDQIATGIDIGNDGEQQRESFFLYLRDRLSGLGGAWTRPPRADIERYPGFKAMQRQFRHGAAVSAMEHMPEALGEVVYRGEALIAEECETLKAAVAETGRGFVEAFLTAPSPGILSTAIANRHYATAEAYLAALGRAMQVEYRAIVDNGFVLQIDAPDLALERHIAFADQPLAVFLDFVESVVATINGALAGIPRERVRLHVCWGNSESPHDSDVPLADILPILLRAEVGALVLPFASPRHSHEMRCFEKMPLAADQALIAGVVDPLTNVIEHPEVVADRLVRAAEIIGDPHRVMAATDCGFDTSAGAGRVATDVAWAKLASLVEGAALASHRL